MSSIQEDRSKGESRAFSEDDFIPISALQHYVFCPRQCALIHVDGAWAENLFTARGHILHEKVDGDTYQTRGTTRIVRGLRIHSFIYGLVGRCDVVEFVEGSSASSGAQIVRPVEFKAGKPKDDLSDKIQLCAQALCLEEMLHVEVKQGAFFYAKVRRRSVVDIDAHLRAEAFKVIDAVREIVSTKTLPMSAFSEKCRSCSLESVCMPKALNPRKLHSYLRELYEP